MLLIKVKGIMFDKPLDTPEKKMVHLQDRINEHVKILEIAFNENGLEPFALLLCENTELYLPLSFEDVNNKFGIIGEATDQFSAFAVMIFSEAWIVKKSAEEADKLEKMGMTISASKHPERIEVVMIVVKVYDEDLKINGKRMIGFNYPIIVKDGVRTFGTSKEDRYAFGMGNIEGAEFRGDIGTLTEKDGSARRYFRMSMN
ncbi:hypothetical protein [Ignavibacterium sp.]|uniref:hypothetical protein n=1 Tax=Ignavibacterium sp. TaxID=2651167 RepID=UPI00307DB7C1